MTVSTIADQLVSYYSSFVLPWKWLAKAIYNNNGNTFNIDEGLTLQDNQHFRTISSREGWLIIRLYLITTNYLGAIARSVENQAI